MNMPEDTENAYIHCGQKEHARRLDSNGSPAHLNKY